LKELIMIFSAHQQTSLSAAAASHLTLIATSTDLFQWFQSAVSGNKAEADIDAKLTECDAIIAANLDPRSSLTNEYGAFRKSLKNAYANFGHDIVRRMGVDECSQVRNLALNIAGGSLTQLTTRAREHLVRSVEGLTVPPLASAA
jgi:hypothetical protein